MGKGLEHVRHVAKSEDQERQELQEARREMYDLIRELGEVLSQSVFCASLHLLSSGGEEVEA